MIITRKAAAGFILLAAIVFLTAHYATPTPGPAVQPASPGQLKVFSNEIKTPTKEVVQYRPPIISFKTPLETALAITATIELFALVCYLSLKKLEPAINKAAETAMRNMRERNERESDE